MAVPASEFRRPPDLPPPVDICSILSPTGLPTHGAHAASPPPRPHGCGYDAPTTALYPCHWPWEGRARAVCMDRWRSFSGGRIYHEEHSEHEQEEGCARREGAEGGRRHRQRTPRAVRRGKLASTTTRPRMPRLFGHWNDVASQHPRSRYRWLGLPPPSVRACPELTSLPLPLSTTCRL